MVQQFDAGRFEGLACPECGVPAVDVWFTNPAVNQYRIWFVCMNCTFSSRVQHADKPKFFDENRVRSDLQEKDLQVIRAAKFKKAPQEFT